jgi:hypothetical protein
LGVQRRHEQGRSDEIRQYVQFGAPWADLTETQRRSGNFDDLRKPGWLPTAVVVNVLEKGDKRPNGSVAEADRIDVDDSRGSASIVLPASFSRSWRPKSIHPIEVIDGQHRLWAFEDEGSSIDFELPVVAFHGLDLSWQAYLFWTINIKPKRINASLAFDLYPLLRNEDWLDRFEGHSIYRETRAQELVEALWSHPGSPWRARINMLGEPGAGLVRQASWVRSLVATFVKRSEGPGVHVGGLFGAPVGEDKSVLPWSAAQQAAFLIYGWSALARAVRSSSAKWAEDLRRGEGLFRSDLDPAFAGDQTLLNTDTGVRGVLYVLNDTCFVRSDELRLHEWTSSAEGRASDETAVSDALRNLGKQPVAAFLENVAAALATFDWRSAFAPALSDTERMTKQALRGSGGYRLLRELLLRHLADGPRRVAAAASEVIDRLGY